MEPCAFFISWYGVLTVAFRAFPSSVFLFKQALQEDSRAMDRLPLENPGSKWPKISIAALKDGAILSREQFEKLREICAMHSAGLERCSFPINRLTLVDFDCRSLEKVVCRRDIDLLPSDPSDKESEDEERYSSVRAVLSEASLDDYFTSRIESSNSNREGHYRDWHRGRTLVAFLPSAADALRREIDSLQTAVEESLPELYSWFSLADIHITIRGL
eukprot:gene7768-8579_t